MGPVLEPSPNEGEVKPMTRNWHQMWGPFYVDTLLTPSRIPSRPCFSTALTSKSQMKVVLSPRKRVGKHLTFGNCPTAQLLAAEWGKMTFFVLILDECCPDSSVHVYHLDELCLCFIEGGTLPKLPPWGIDACGDQHRVLLKGTKVRSQLSRKDPFSEKEILHHPRMTETPRKERGGPRHPQGDLGRSAVRKSLWTNSAHWVSKTVQTFRSARGMWQF